MTLQYVGGGSLTIFVVLTIFFSLINGLTKSGTHLFLGISIAAFSACTVQLIRWYRIGDLDPKFRLLIASMAASLGLLCIVGNVYFWAAVPAPIQ